jgi:hypothetical protein
LAAGQTVKILPAHVRAVFSVLASIFFTDHLT